VNLELTISLYCYGTSESVKKAWDTRGRSRAGTEDMLRNYGYKQRVSPARMFFVNPDEGHTWTHPDHPQDQVHVDRDSWEYSRKDGSASETGTHEHNDDLEDMLRSREFDQLPVHEKARQNERSDGEFNFIPEPGD
jgi:hypothetical protein